MALNVISNFAANVAHRNLVSSDMAATSSLAKLSAGTRVLSAKDDAASLAIGSRLSAEVAALQQASVNAGQGTSMLQIADGAMGKVNDILIRMKTLAVQAGSGQLSSTERAMLDTEFQALSSEIDRIAEDTEFNGQKLINGSQTLSATPENVETADGVVAITLSSFTSGDTFNGRVVGLGAAAGENDLPGAAVQYAGHPLAGFVQRVTRFLAYRVDAGRVPK